MKESTQPSAVRCHRCSRLCRVLLVRMRCQYVALCFSADLHSHNSYTYTGYTIWSHSCKNPETLTRLDELAIGHSQVHDLAPLQHLLQLRMLRVDHTRITLRRAHWQVLDLSECESRMNVTPLFDIWLS